MYVRFAAEQCTNVTNSCNDCRVQRRQSNLIGKSKNATNNSPSWAVPGLIVEQTAYSIVTSGTFLSARRAEVFERTQLFLPGHRSSSANCVSKAHYHCRVSDADLKRCIILSSALAHTVYKHCSRLQTSFHACTPCKCGTCGKKYSVD